MIQRDLYLNKIRPLIDNELIKVITGIRRCGKSYMLKLIIEELKSQGVNEENIILINLDDLKHNRIRDYKELDELVINLTKDIEGKIYLLIDEIQNVNKWEKSINAYKISLDTDIYITGSNSKLLSGEFATYLTGRYREIKIYPFSFKEFLDYKIKENPNLNKNTDINKLFNEYLEYGGMPVTLQLNEDEKLKYLEDLYNSILFKDILQRYPIDKIDSLRRVSQYLTINMSNTFSANNISKYFKNNNIKINDKTITKYANCIENSCLIIKAKNENIKRKEILNQNPKYYLADHGFKLALTNEYNADKGNIIENIVYLELLRHEYKVTVGKENNYEIDFIARKNKEKLYIQVSYLLNNQDTIKREISPLLKIKDNYPKYLITMDPINLSQDGIIHINLIDFLTKFI